MTENNPQNTPSSAIKDLTEDPQQRWRIRSFVTRTGRISTAQQRALDVLMPIHGIPFDHKFIDLGTTPTVLEIGFGMGDTTAAIAAARPDVNFIGVEVHTPGVGALLNRIEQDDLNNLRIIQHDAVEVLEHMLAPSSLTGVHLYFPDPWHKARHHKRRLVQGPFIAQLVSRLQPGGYLHCATDWENYAEQMLEGLSAEGQLVNTVATYSTPQNPLVLRPETKFERRGVKLGHGVWDLVFRRVDALNN